MSSPLEDCKAASKRMWDESTVRPNPPFVILSRGEVEILRRHPEWHPWFGVTKEQLDEIAASYDKGGGK